VNIKQNCEFRFAPFFTVTNLPTKIGCICIASPVTVVVAVAAAVDVTVVIAIVVVVLVVVDSHHQR